MRAVIAIERMSRERAIALTLRPAAGPVTDLLQMTGLGQRVTLAPRFDEPSPAGSFLERVELELAREPTAPGRARAELRDAIADRLGESDRSTLTLLTSELVTNAVIHTDPGAGETVGLRISTYHDRVRVEVTDSGAGFDLASLGPRPRETGGHGLVVVDGLSSRWGTRRAQINGAGGFCVWFELDLAGEATGANGAAELTKGPAAAIET